MMYNKDKNRNKERIHVPGTTARKNPRTFRRAKTPFFLGTFFTAPFFVQKKTRLRSCKRVFLCFYSACMSVDNVVYTYVKIRLKLANVHRLVVKYGRVAG